MRHALFALSTLLLLTACPEGGRSGGGNDEPRGAAPTIEITAPQEGRRLYADQDVVVEVLVADEDDAASDLDVTFFIDDEEMGTRDADGAGVARRSLSLAEGSYALRAVVIDSDEREAEAAMELVVGGPNTMPECEITSPEPESFVAANTAVTLRGFATDADVPSDLLTAEWETSRGGDLGEADVAADGSIELPLEDGLVAGTHVLTLTVRDEVGGRCQTTLATEAAPAPTVTISRPTAGATVHEGVPFPLVATINTTMGPIAVDVSSDVAGVLHTDVLAGPNGTLDLDIDPAGGGAQVLVVTAEDGRGLTGSAQVALTVNAAPSAPVVEITPVMPESVQPLTVSILTASVDPEGSAVTYTYAWFRNGGTTSYSGTTVPAAATARGQEWTVRVTASDGNAVSEPGTDTVTILNNAPVVTPPTVEPSPIYTDDDAVCVPGSTSDPDGDAVTIHYAWQINGIGQSINVDTLPASMFEKDDVLICTTTPDDTLTLGNPVNSPAVTVANTPPEAPDIEITPSNPESYEDLDCTVLTGSTDADGDSPITYDTAWYQDGQLTGYTGTVPAAATADNEVWECEVTPYDGEDYGPPAVESVTIGAQPQLLDVGTHASTYSASQVRGYWFQAPVSFTITALRVPTNMSGSQYIQVMRFLSGQPPEFSASTTNYLTLFSTMGTPGTDWIPVNIPVAAGDFIGILGARNVSGSTMNNSYRASGNYTTSIDGASMVLTRMVYQSSMVPGGPAGPVSSNNGGQIGRVEVEYVP